MTDDSLEAMLKRVGGSELVSQYEKHSKNFKPNKQLPHADADAYSYSYCVIVGGLAALADTLIDQSFRLNMNETHRLLDPEEQNIREKAVQDLLKTQNLKPSSGPAMSMDFYDQLNDSLNLQSGFKLRAKNHRILNHTNQSSVIDMLMSGDAGLGGSIKNSFPKMSFEQAKKLYNLHIAADRGTPQSLPLKLMSWLWEESAKVGQSNIAGDGSPIYKFLQNLVPNGNWSVWINNFSEGNPIPSPANLGEAIMKLYDLKIINERVFWTSNAGAFVSGFKRRLIITVLMELAVEVYALFEGIRLGYIEWQGSPPALKRDILYWRDQPKYVDMKIIAQCLASSYGAIRTVVSQDPLSLNFTSLGMTLKHLVFYPAMLNRHYTRLASFSRIDVQTMSREFMERTGIQLPIFESKEYNEMHSFDKRIIDMGCVSTRVRILGSRYQNRMIELIERMEHLGRLAENNDFVLSVFDPLCTSWYLEEVDDDDAIKKLESDISAVEAKIKLFIIK